MIRYPFGYSTQTRTLEQLRAWLLVHHHPEYVRRLCAWLESKQGQVGIGGGWRADGTQPDLPGFAPEGTSFHQNQQYADGFIGACAVDLVAVDGPDGNNSHDGVTWDMTIPQGTDEAVRWGLHCNVGAPPRGEPWHMQPIEIDGWASWKVNGSPAPALNYPLPNDDDDEDVPMYSCRRLDKQYGYHIGNGLQRSWLTDDDYARLTDAGVRFTYLGVVPVETVKALGQPVPQD